MKLFLGSKFILLVDGRYAGTVEVQRFEKFPKTALIGNFSIFLVKYGEKYIFKFFLTTFLMKFFSKKYQDPWENLLVDRNGTLAKNSD